MSLKKGDVGRMRWDRLGGWDVVWHGQGVVWQTQTASGRGGRVMVNPTSVLQDDTCGAVTLAVRLPACISISHAYSRVSLPRGKPSAENMA